MNLPDMPQGNYFDHQMRRETFSSDQMEEYARAAIALAMTDIVIEMDGEGDIYNIVANRPGVRVAVIDRFSMPERDADTYALPVWGDPGEVEDHVGFRAADPNVEPDYVAVVLATIGECHD